MFKSVAGKAQWYGAVFTTILKVAPSGPAVSLARGHDLRGEIYSIFQAVKFLGPKHFYRGLKEENSASQNKLFLAASTSTSLSAWNF